MSYLAKSEQAPWRQRLRRASNRSVYTEALDALHRELTDRNPSAPDGLPEGLDETVTLH